MSNIQKLRQNVEDKSQFIDSVVIDIIEPYSKDLDNYVAFIRDILKDGENPPKDEELDDFCLNLSTLIYFAGGLCEHLGIRDDISKIIYKELYHSTRNDITKGTVADKDSIAELASQSEQLINICYNRAYKILKMKIENAQELLSSCKKVLTRRMNEYQLTHLGGNLS